MRKICILVCISVGLALPGSAWAGAFGGHPGNEPRDGIQAACMTTATTMCLFSGEFAVSATYQTADGQSGQAHAVALTDDTGYLWFFNNANIEVVLKVLDGCPLNSHFWVFAGGLTNVHVDILVTEVAGPTSKHYINQLNTAFQPVQDTSFGFCFVSSARYKDDIKDMAGSSDDLMKLRPVTFRYKPDNDDGAHLLQYGLVAEEVARVYPGLVQFDKEGKPQAVRYHLVNAMVLNEVQKEHRETARQRGEIDELRQQVEALTRRLQALDAMPAKAKRAAPPK